MNVSSAGILTITFNPSIDWTLSVAGFTAGKVNRVSREQSDAGGKGINVASLLADLGLRTGVTGFLGEDNSSPFEALFRQKHIEDRFIRVPGRTRTNIKIIDEEKGRTTDVNFPGLSVRQQDLEALTDTIHALSDRYDWFVFSGSVPESVPIDWYQELTKRLSNRGRRVMIDTSGDALKAVLFSSPYAIKPNLEELQDLVGEKLDHIEDVIQKGLVLIEKGIPNVIVSMGARGALFLENGRGILAEPPASRVRSTVGAGDALVAGFILGKLQGLDLAACARLATGVAVAKLGQVGAILPERSVVESIVRNVTIRDC